MSIETGDGSVGATPPTEDPLKAEAPSVLRTLKYVVLAASGVIVLGSLLPWASVSLGIFSHSFSGTSAGGDGIATLILGLISAIAIGFGIWRPQVWMVIVSLAAIGFTAVISVIDAINLARTSSNTGEFQISVEIGIGLWLCVIASVVGLGICIMLLKQGSAIEPAPKTVEVNGKDVPVGKILYPTIAIIGIGILLMTHPWTTAIEPSSSDNSASSSSKSSSAFGDTTTTTGPPPQRLSVGDTAHFVETTDGLTSMTVRGFYPAVTTDEGDSASSGKQYDVIDVEQCASTSASEATPTDYPIRLMLDNGSQVSSGYMFGNPQVPDLASVSDLGSADSVAPGACARGWVVFSVPVGANVTQVLMTAEPADYSANRIITWSVK